MHDLDAAPAVAVVGMSGRFPGAASPAELWANLAAGVEGISRGDELFDGAPPEEAGDPDFVAAEGVLRGAEWFDAGFFGMSPLEATVTDPQQRLFLECAWEAMEDAGYAPGATPAAAVFAGVGWSSHLQRVEADPALAPRVTALQLILGNDKDTLATRVAHRLDLRGPALTVQTSCSTSLVAVHLACESLLSGECDLALAGGASVSTSPRRGYRYQEGGILSPDGRCRPFDAEAAGTVRGSGVGVVVLRRLEDALRDGDTVHAVLLGSAVNNDGAARVGYTAPGVQGQAAVISQALAVAGVEPRTVSYVEAHGSGTPLGDTVELAALAEAFAGVPPASCALGSLKASVGHLDAAAGVAGLIKVVQALRHRTLPPSPHLRTPCAGLAGAPFYVNPHPLSWERNGAPLRAGVSSFGLGGTNAHVVVQEAPPAEAPAPSRPHQLLVLSARDQRALYAAAERLAEHLASGSAAPLAEVAHTLRVGRVPFAHRRAVVVRPDQDAAAVLRARDPERTIDGVAPAAAPGVALLFPGIGGQYAGMAAGLYHTEPAFRAQVDRCAQVLCPLLGLDLRDALWPADAVPAAPAAPGVDLRALLGRGDPAPAGPLDRTEVAHAALFSVEYALARTWEAWGIRPAAVIGHSLGDYAAACVAGVFTLEDALALVVARARLVDSLSPGAMAAVSVDAEALAPWLEAGVEVAAANAPGLSVIAGPVPALERVEAALAGAGHAVRRLPAARAFHTAALEPLAEPLRALLAGVRLSAPAIPMISCVTGGWLAPEQATDPGYWARHLRHPVRFDRGAAALLAHGVGTMVEVGPGQVLAGFIRQHAAARGADAPVLVASLRHHWEAYDDQGYLLAALGRLWVAGAVEEWTGFTGGERRRRVPLPPYPFQRERYAPSPSPRVRGREGEEDDVRRIGDPDRWLYVPAWKRTPARPPAEDAPRRWLLLADGTVAAPLARLLRDAGCTVVRAAAGPSAGSEGKALRVEVDDPGAYPRLLEEAARALGGPPDGIVHLWGLDADGTGADAFPPARRLGYDAFLHLARALEQARPAPPPRVWVLTRGAHEVTGGEALRPEQATVLGVVRALAEELGWGAGVVDVDDAAGGARVAAALAEELRAGAPGPLVALRGGYRWVRGWERHPAGPAADASAGLRPRGVYLVTGGLGTVGLALSEHLARAAGARLVLTSRAGLPPRDQWDEAEGTAAARIRAVRRLEALGAEVMVARADAADAHAMAAAVAAARDRWGPVNGVLHCAGVLDADLTLVPLRDTDPAQAEPHFDAKVRGAYVLERLFADAELDFCLLASSLNTVYGGLYTAAYTGANAFLDAFACALSRRGGARWTSVAWDAWERAEDPAAHSAGGSPELRLSAGEGREVLRRLLARPPGPQVAVSTAELHARMRAWRPEQVLRPREVGEEAPSTAADPEDAPRPGVESVIAQAWRELLGVERVGRRDNFFALGGHSLLGLQVLSRLRQRLGVHLPLHAVFHAPTVAALADEAAAALRKEAGTEEGDDAPVVSRPPGSPAPLALEQAWMVEAIDGLGLREHAFFDLCYAYRLRGPLAEAALARAVARLVARHEALRSTVRGGPDGLLQWPHAPPADPLERVDLRGMAPGEREEAARAWVQDAAARPLDLERGPLFRAALLRLAGDDHVLAVHVHHVMFDDWSEGVVFGELARLYNEEAAGVPAGLDRPPVQVGDVGVWQRRPGGAATRARELAFWRGELTPPPPPLRLGTPLPDEPPPPPGLGFPIASRLEGARELFGVPADAAEGVRALAAAHGTTPFIVLLASLSVALHHRTGARDLLVAAQLAQRGRPEMESVVGFLVNILPLRVRLEPDLPFRALLARAAKTAAGAQAHASVAQHQIQRTLGVDVPLPVTLNLVSTSGAAAAASGLHGLELSAFAFEQQPMCGRYLNLLLRAGREMRGQAVFNAARVPRDEVRALLDDWFRVLVRAARDPGGTVAGLGGGAGEGVKG